MRGFVAVAECDAAVGQVINVGSNFEISIGDTARLIAELMGRRGDDSRATSSACGRRAARSSGCWPTTRARATLAGWTPEYAGVDGLARGLRETIDWFRDRDNLRRYKAGRYNL